MVSMLSLSAEDCGFEPSVRSRLWNWYLLLLN